MRYKSEPSDSPFFSQNPSISISPSEKSDLHIRVLAGFIRPTRTKPCSENISIPGPLVAFGRGAFLPYFGKQSDI
jgi:hypothetical protein